MISTATEHGLNMNSDLTLCISCESLHSAFLLIYMSLPNDLSLKCDSE